MLNLTRWCIAHRRIVLVGWVAIAIATTVVAQAVGRDYANNFTLPGTESQHALDLLEREFPAQSGDVDTIVFHVAHGTIDSPAVRAAIEPAARARRDASRTSSASSAPTARAARVEVSRDRRTAFATVNYDKRANLLPNDTGKPVLDARRSRSTCPGLQVAAGGQVIEQAEGFNIGPATTVGVIAALVILLITFGSLVAAGHAADHRRPRPDHRRRADRPRDARHEHVERRARAGADDRPRRRHRLRALHRHPLPRELPARAATSSASVLEAMDTSGPGDPARRHDRRDRAARHVRDRRRASCTASRSPRCSRCC